MNLLHSNSIIEKYHFIQFIFSDKKTWVRKTKHVKYLKNESGPKTLNYWIFYLRYVMR